jgi:hemolysin activation/secretion protein
MNHKKFIPSLLASLCLAAFVLPAAQAQTAQPSADVQLDVQKFELAGQTNLLSVSTRTELLNVLLQGGPRRMSEQDLNALLQKAQQALDAKLPQRFVLSIPAQTLQERTLSVVVQPRLTQVSVEATPEFDEANVRASLPSLKPGQALAQNWVDLRELQMANDSPLKLTTVEFPVQPDQGVKAKVKATSPYGSTQWGVGVSNMGNDMTGRAQTQLSGINANLTGQDDVLNLTVGSSLNPLGDTGFAALRYSMPDYAGHVSHGFELTHSKGSTTTPFFSLSLSNQAKYSDVGYRQTHYLGDLASQLNAAKLTVGASYVTSESDAKLSNLSLQKTDIKTLPVALSFESDFKVEPQNQSHLRLDWVASRASWMGDTQLQEWEAARSGVSGSYSIVRLSLNGRTDLGGSGAFAWQYTGQYSAQKLLPVFQFNAANGFVGVRGFVNATAMGDSGQVLRLELESAKLMQESDVRGYGFYDAGIKKGGSDERSLTLSSYGVGVRLKGDDRRLKVDLFSATKGQGRELDLVSNATAQKSRTSAWIMASYSF